MWDRDGNAGPVAVDAYPWLVHYGTCGGAFIASNVVVTAGHCSGSTIESDDDITSSEALRAAIRAMNNHGTRLEHPDFVAAVDHQGTDIALWIYPEAVAIPRALMIPLGVAPGGSAVPSTARLLSHMRHGTDCAWVSFASTYLNFDAVDDSTDDDDMPMLEFGSPGSEVCLGDSGSPVISGSRLVSLVSTGTVGGGPSMQGPWLSHSGGVRAWLTRHALDRDDDGVEAWEDNCDTRWNPDQRDGDDDGVGDVCDVCADVAYEGAFDFDGDGYIDCLDPCPQDPKGDPIAGCAGTLRGESGDSDCDGQCDAVGTGLTPPDPCPFVQDWIPRENSNFEAEDRWDADVLPDSCDPAVVPRGEIDLAYSQSTTLSEYNPTFYKARTWVQIDDHVKRTHRQSRNISNSGPASVTVEDVPTDARFCQPSALVTNCFSEAAINESQLYPELTAATELPGQPYHRIKLGSGARGAPVTRDYDDGTETLQWDYAADEGFWEDHGILVVEPETNPYAPGVTTSGLGGVMWFHAGSHVGHPGNPENDAGTGVHPGPEDINDSAQLASSYFPIDPESTSTVAPPASFDFSAVYARSLGAVLRIGGHTATGASAGLWRFDAASGDAFEVWQPMQLGEIQAVAFDALARELVVLDAFRAKSSAPVVMRLLRIDVFGAGTRIVKTWTRDGTCQDFGLLVDGRGRLVLSANQPSSTKGDRWSLFTLQGEGAAFQSRRIKTSSGLLASKPWSNELTLYSPIRTGGPVATVVSLDQVPQSIDGIVLDVATCF